MIEFSEEQAMLLETALDFCAKRSPMATVRAGIDSVDTYDAAVWQEMVDLGWLGIAVPEAHGGLGMGLAGAVPVAESMGRHLLGNPFLATTLAAYTLAEAGNAAQQQTWLPDLASGAIGTVAVTEADGNWRLDEIAAQATRQCDDLVLTGCKCQVLDAMAAKLLLVSVILDGRARVVLVERAQIPDAQMQREVVLDETRRSYRVDLSGVQVPEEHLLPGAALTAIESAALLLISAEISGGLHAVLHTIVEYLNTRKQFDRLIGSYQALKHPTVDILLAEEACRSHLYYAATRLQQGDVNNAEVALRMAKAQGSEAFAYAGDRAVQFHGGFGFTYECDAQLYLRRALWCQHQFGDERHQRQVLAPLLLDQTA